MTLWDLADRAAPRRLGEPLDAHQSAVYQVVFAPDGRTLATASEDTTAILWDMVKLDELRVSPLDRACRAVGNGLSNEDWARLAPPDVPYEQTCPG